MTDASASERAYQRLKRDILSGAIPVGLIDSRALGDQLRMSVTPVREALARLSAEKLVRLTPHQGYVVALPSARQLENLYELSGVLLHFCLERASRSKQSAPERGCDWAPAGSYAADMAALVNGIAAAHTNVALRQNLAALNDQLHCVRRCEPKLFAEANQDLAVFVSLWKSGNVGDLRLRLRDHHRSRLMRVDALARLLTEEAGVA